MVTCTLIPAHRENLKLISFPRSSPVLALGQGCAGHFTYIVSINPVRKVASSPVTGEEVASGSFK